jgi:rod shape-determining protein MreD
MSPTAAVRLRLSVILVLALLLQTTIVPDVRVLGVCADLMLLCTACAGLVGGPEMGAIAGFAAGLLADLFLTTTPLGLTALVFSLIGYSVGTIRYSVLQEGWLLAPATGFLASSAGVVTFVLAGVMVGQEQLTKAGPVGIVKTALLVGAMNAVLAIPVYRLFLWAVSGSARSGESNSEISALADRRPAPGHFRRGDDGR